MKLNMKRYIYTCCLFSLLGLSLSAHADTNWEVQFAFDNPGGKPSTQTMRDYMMGCLPAGSYVPPPPPPDYPEGPFKLTTPDLTDAQVYNYLNNCNLKPASVTGIEVYAEE